MSSELVAMLELQQIGPGRYIGQNLPETKGVIFGGQLLAQMVAATAKTLNDFRVKSMHTVFVRGGSPAEPVELVVDTRHVGRTFATVDVSVVQGDRLCTRGLVLVDRPDGDLIRHQAEPPVVEAPDRWPEPESVDRGWEIRIGPDVDIVDPEATGPPELNLWSRFREAPGDDWASQALLAYASDGFLIATAMRPHPGIGQALAHVSISTTVVSQTLTFHDRFDARDWLLLAHRSPHSGNGRSYGRADAFTTDGRLVASYAQENMIRTFAADRKPREGERALY